MSELISSYAGLIAALVACGLFSGFVAGLFGIGGGAVIVPVRLLRDGIVEGDASLRIGWQACTDRACLAPTEVVVPLRRGGAP